MEGAQFADALAEALEPRMRLAGEMAPLDTFKQFFEGRTLDKGTQVSHPHLEITSFEDRILYI